MLTIDRLRLYLPSKYQDRAHFIARRVAEELAEISVGNDRKIDRLSMPPIRVAPGTTDQQVARQIALAVQTQMNGKGRSAQ